jgi:hypothetical protein
VGFLSRNPENWWYGLESDELKVLETEFVRHPNHVTDKFFGIKARFENPSFRGVTTSVSHQCTTFLQNYSGFGVTVNFCHFYNFLSIYFCFSSFDETIISEQFPKVNQNFLLKILVTPQYGQNLAKGM